MSDAKIKQPGPNELENQDSGMRSLVQMLRGLFFCLRILIILVFIYMLFSGMFRVDEQNEAMLFRFGALQRRVLEPGQGETPILTSGRWYWAWPAPIDWVKFIPAEKSVTVDTGSLFLPWTNPQTGQLQQSEGPATLKPGTDGYVLTGDTNIMHTKWDVVYRVVDASRYYLEFYDDSDAEPGSGKKRPARGADAIIRNLLVNAVIQEMATWSVEDLLGNVRTLEDGTVENIKEKIDKKDTNIVRMNATLNEGTFHARPLLLGQHAIERKVKISQCIDHRAIQIDHGGPHINGPGAPREKQAKVFFGSTHSDFSLRG